MGRDDRVNLDPAEITRDFERVRRGYNPGAVDHHLALIESKVKAMLEMGVREPDESYNLVLKATKKSIDEALLESRSMATAIVAEAESAAERVRSEAEIDRFSVEEKARERYVELGLLTEQRAEEVAVLDAEIAQRQSLVRSIAVDLERLASSLGNTPTAGVAAPVAAHSDNGIEVVLPVERGNNG